LVRQQVASVQYGRATVTVTVTWIS